MNLCIIKKLAGGIIYESHLSTIDKISALSDILNMTESTQVINYIKEAVKLNLLKDPRAKNGIKSLSSKIFGKHKTLALGIGALVGYKLLKNVINPCQRLCKGDNSCLKRCAKTNKLIVAIQRLQKVNCNLTTQRATCQRIKDEKIDKLQQELNEI